MRLFPAPLLLLAAVACEPAAPDFQIVPGERVGPVTAGSTWEDLQNAFPDGRAERIDIPLGEGFTQPGAIVWPDDPLRRFELVWADSAGGTDAAMVILRGDTTEWRTVKGLSLGTSLAELERINGGPFRLAGFGWDYSGTVIDWLGGNLDRDSATAGLMPLLTVRLLPSPDKEIPRRLLGDGGFRSDDSAMVALEPTVSEIYVRLH